jgi:hypothetical protein
MKMASSGIFHRVALVTSDVSKEFSSPIIKVSKIGVLGTSAVTIKRESLASYC